MEAIKVITVKNASTEYTVDLGFVPQFVHVRNITQYAADSKKTEFFWCYGMENGSYKGVENLGTTATNGRKPIEASSNGFTPYDSSNVAARQILVDTGSSKITKAANAVVTSTTHGLATGDVVSFGGIVAGMVEMNGRRSKITVLTADTFSCDNIDSTGFTTWSATEAYGQIILVSKLNQDSGKQGVTLGTDILGTKEDVLLLVASDSASFAAVTH